MLSRAMGVITIMCLNLVGGGAVSHSLLGECSFFCIKTHSGAARPQVSFTALSMVFHRVLSHPVAQENLPEEAECP